jgi:outer membrane protein TolC
VQYNRIAGPNNPFTGPGTQQFNGVMLARINTDLSLAEFEASVRDMVSDLENSYWELYFAYRNLEAAKAGRASALQTWQKVYALFRQGGRGGELDKEAQAREQYFFFRSQVQQSLNDLYRAENRLRYMMGISVSDGRLIRPADEPTTARVAFDWYEVHCEALSRAPELREQKWRIKERELELIAARNLMQPRLDAAGYYRWRGLGDELINYRPDSEHTGLINTNAFGELTSGKYQEWQLGLQMKIPIGFRREMAAVRHYQLQLARERARLQDAELEVSHQLGDAIRNLEGNYDLAQTNFNRRVAAEKQVEAVKAAYDVDTVTLDLLLDAQRRRADAEVAYYRTLVDYVRGIAMVHYRKGSLLEYNGVYLAEGPWANKAYFDAERMARQRDASYYLNYGYTRPNVVSQGPYLQHKEDAQVTGASFEVPMHDMPTMATPLEGITPEMLEGKTLEELPVPQATPKASSMPRQLPAGQPSRALRLNRPQSEPRLSAVPSAPQAPAPAASQTSDLRLSENRSRTAQDAHFAPRAPQKEPVPNGARKANEAFDWGTLGMGEAKPKSRVVVRSSATQPQGRTSAPKKAAPQKAAPRPASPVKRAAAVEPMRETASSAAVTKAVAVKPVAQTNVVSHAVAPKAAQPKASAEWQSKSVPTSNNASQPSGGWKAVR